MIPLSIPHTPQGEQKTIQVSEEDPVRLDQFLVKIADLPSRAYGQKLIKDGNVLVNDKTSRSSRKLFSGDRVTITIPPSEPSVLAPEEIELDIRHEDENLVVVNKPAGMVVHPGAGVRSGTLVNALLYRYGDLAVTDEPFRPGIVHRLDKKTSGLLLVARNRLTHVRLAEAIRLREVARRYLAVVWGNVPDSGVIEAPLGRSKRDRKRMAVRPEGKDALSRFENRERFLYTSLVEVKLETGRTHQIRVHFSHKGHPVFGDPEYGGRKKALKGIAPDRRRSAGGALDRIERQALHAWRLRFVHPVTGEAMEFTSEPPSDMIDLLQYLRKERDVQ